MISFGLFYLNDDYNLLISGKSSNISNDDVSTVNNGFIMRITPIGFI